MAHTSASQTRPRILLIANTAWYLSNFQGRLLERLAANGYEIIIATPSSNEVNGALFNKYKFIQLPFSRKGRNPLIELIAVGRFLRLFNRVQPNLVLTWTPKPNIYGGIAGRILHVPVIPNISGLGFVFIRSGLQAKAVGRLYRYAFARAPAVFFQNNEDMATFKAAGWVTGHNAERLPGSGVDLERFQPRPMSPQTPFVFLFMGRLLADKGLRELVVASRRLRNEGRNFVVRIAGFLDPGNPAAISKQELDEWITEGSVEYLGPLTDVTPALFAAHCVVLPSYREGVPRSLLEAAAAARPIITTDATGCRNAVVAGKTGFLCMPRDAVSLAACMAKVLDLSPQALYDMGLAGRAYIEEHFSNEIVIKAYLRQCRKLTSSLRKSR